MIPSRVSARSSLAAWGMAATLILGATAIGSCQTSDVEDTEPPNTEPSTTPTTSIDDAVDSLPEFPYTMDEWEDMVWNGTGKYELSFLEGLRPDTAMIWGLRYGFWVEVLLPDGQATLDHRPDRLRLGLGTDGLVQFAGNG